MTRKEQETLERLADKVEMMAKQLNQNTKDTAEIKITLASWTGGRKTLVWVISAVMGFGVALATIYEAIRSIPK